METNWERSNYKIQTEIKNFQENDINLSVINNIICVLCGGLQDDATPHEFVKKRLDKAYEIYKNNKKTSIILILGGGTYHKVPILNKDNFIIHESSAGATYLYNKGVNPKFILREWSSYDTIANGFFAFTNYFNYLDLDKIILITSDFHMERSKTIFDYFNKLFNKNINIEYIETKSDLGDEIFNIRNKREQESNANFKKNIVNKINNVKSFINWFYTEHKAYKSILEYSTTDNKCNSIDKTY